MKKKLLGIKVVSILTAIVLISSFAACAKSSGPDASVKGFFTALKSYDITTAQGFLSAPDEALLKTQSDSEKEVVKNIFSKVSCTVASTTTDKETATVKAKITAPDLTKISQDMMSELLPKMMEAMQKPDGGQAEAEKMTMEYLNKRLADPKMPTLNTDVDIKVKLDSEKKKWVIEMDDNLRNAITGNVNSAPAQ